MNEFFMRLLLSEPGFKNFKIFSIMLPYPNLTIPGIIKSCYQLSESGSSGLHNFQD